MEQIKSDANEIMTYRRDLESLKEMKMTTSKMRGDLTYEMKMFSSTFKKQIEADHDYLKETMSLV